MARIRITGGQWRSRLIQVTDAEGLRPTPDRVRETLFNWLGQNLSGLSCLDIFAGSGILGFEAASRGAGPVTLVERSRTVFNQLCRNADVLDAADLRLVCGDALKFVSPVAAGYDLLFLDPPYHQGWLERMEPKLPGLIKPQGRIYAEAEHPLESLGAWRVVKRGQAGQVHFHLLEQP
ncbi:16S rRNA (guanine(966)-N(2))-methyltransferase RsmD [Denitratisoma oestradiolicum]|uniref:Putative methyltransferase n=1 Tax=Denitratisoma oestradiolicum TaxID=311182 RepID=A0A6S6Y2N9_9PROT|nr:16S rRNA (guanine(966)-N(2))-methyltransferase RsmD [Denitratisoma oestradiolicum]TWO81828.1 16S rRNA (guanine(966)-N(2))-methyltransferase RsmD [Denitratisoma oestradiolicum]CAB1370795.1 putative methyltransferase [Denitratisoma oestradiolicum]